MHFLKWLYPGMKLKRWLFLCVVGLLVITFGILHFFISVKSSAIFLGIMLILGGLVLVITGLIVFIKSLIQILLPTEEREVVDRIYKKRQLERGPKIVVIGGGTGLSTLLQGLKQYTSNLTAIVTVADDGGSSGRIRDEFDILPPGDIRNCLVALADVEPLMRDLFQYRFQGDTSLKGHNFGNLFITVLSQVTGDFEKAIRESSKILAIRGRVVPSTLEKVMLVAEYADGSKCYGESSIPKKHQRIKTVSLIPEGVRASKDAIEFIQDADAIIFGPGSLYTSILPNLLVHEIHEAIMTANASKIYICNVMTQPGETDNYKVSEHIKAIFAHTNPSILDFCISNIARIPDHMLERYRTEDKFPVVADIATVESMGVKVVDAELVSVLDYIRHDSNKLAKLVIDIVSSEKKANIE